MAWNPHFYAVQVAVAKQVDLIVLGKLFDL